MKPTRDLFVDVCSRLRSLVSRAAKVEVLIFDSDPRRNAELVSTFVGFYSKLEKCSTMINIYEKGEEIGE